MTDQLDILLNFLTAYDGSGAEKAKKDLADMNAGTGVKGSAGAGNSQAINTDTQAIKDQVKAANDLVDARQRDVQAARTQVMEYRTLQRAGSMLTQIGTTFFVPAAAVLTGASALAANYVKNVKVATDLTDAWKTSTDSIAYSESRMGEVLTQVELPALQQADRLLSSIATFMQENPGAVSGALNAVATVAGIAGLTMLLGKGITLYADVQYIGATFALIGSENALTAATIAQTAATEMLTLAQSGPTGALAATMGGGGFAGGATAASGGFLAGLGTVVGAVLAVVGGILAGNAGYSWLQSKGVNSNAPDAWTSERQMVAGADAVLQTIAKAGPLFWDSVRTGKPIIDEFKDNINNTTISIGKLLGVVDTVVANNAATRAAIAGANGIENTELNHYNALKNQPEPTGAHAQAQTAAEIYQAGLDEFTNYQKQLTSNQKSYDDAVKAENTSTTQQLAELESNYEANRLIQTRDFIQSETQAREDFDLSQEKAARDFQESQTQAQTAYLQSQADASRNFQESQAKAEFSYEQSRSDAIRNFNESELTAQQDYQTQLADLEQSHNDKMADLTSARDALGLIKEKQSYDEQKAKDATNFATADAKRKADFAQQQADAQRNYEEQRADSISAYSQQQSDAKRNYDEQRSQAIANYNQQQADAKANYDLSDQRRVAAFNQQQIDEANNEQAQIKQIQDAHNAKLAQLQSNLNEENQAEEQAFQERLAVIDGYLGASGQALLAQMAITKNAYDQLLAELSMQANQGAAKNGSMGLPIATRDIGGYWSTGTIAANMSGSNEFVANPSSTRFAEQAIGGQLTQATFMAAFGGMRGYNDQRTQHFSGMTANDVAMMESMQRRIAKEEFARQMG